MTNFEATLRILARYIYNSTDLLAATDAVMAQVPVNSTLSDHDQRVLRALGSSEVMEHVKNKQKINAIKELRCLDNCGLKEAKDAIEDERVWGSYDIW